MSDKHWRDLYYEQKAEIERLRKALKEIMDKQCGGGAYAIARKALNAPCEEMRRQDSYESGAFE